MDGQEYADNFSRFIIIGGGISGLSAASTLAQRGIKDFRFAMKCYIKFIFDTINILFNI